MKESSPLLDAENKKKIKRFIHIVKNCAYHTHALMCSTSNVDDYSPKTLQGKFS